MPTPKPSVEAERAADELEREDDKPWDEDFKLALALAFDRFAAQRGAAPGAPLATPADDGSLSNPVAPEGGETGAYHDLLDRCENNIRSMWQTYINVNATQPDVSTVIAWMRDAYSTAEGAPPQTGEEH